jgi:transmembrane sensor
MIDTNPSPGRREEPIATVAARWVMRLDRGLSPAEQDDYLQWLAADGRHGEAMNRQRHTWNAFDRLAGLQASVEAVPDPELLNPENFGLINEQGLRAPNGPSDSSRRLPASGRRRAFFWPAALTIAAVLAVGYGVRHSAPFSKPAVALSPASDLLRLPPIEERTLADGSILRLNRGAVVTVDFSLGERRVRLERGEAAFTVAKDAARPFVVAVAGMTVRAIGTDFNVRHDDHAVDVIVTEGRVAVARDGSSAPATTTPVVAAGQRVVVPLAEKLEAPQVSTPPPEEVARRLAWQPRLLTFSDEPLAVILNEFNRHNPVMLRLDDPALQGVRLSARFRSDNVPGFLRLLESEFGVRGHAQPNGEIALRRKR